MNTLFASVVPAACPASATSVAAPVSVPMGRRVPMRLFVRDLVREASIGVYAHERQNRQRVRIALDLDVMEAVDAVPFLALVDAVLEAGHIVLVETMAERIAACCLAQPVVEVVRVRVEKLDVVSEAAGVGIEIVRGRPA